MTALAADKSIKWKKGELLTFPVDDGDRIYAGALVAVNADGYLVPGSDTSGLIFVGIATEQANNTSGADGAISCIVRREGVIECLIASATQANVGDLVYLVDDQTVGVAATTTNDIPCGKIVGYVDATHVWVDIGPAINN